MDSFYTVKIKFLPIFVTNKTCQTIHTTKKKLREHLLPTHQKQMNCSHNSVSIFYCMHWNGYLERRLSRFSLFSLHALDYKQQKLLHVKLKNHFIELTYASINNDIPSTQTPKKKFDLDVLPFDFNKIRWFFFENDL